LTSQAGRRAQQRFDIQMAVQVTYQGNRLETVTRNVSLGGMYLEQTEELEADALPFGALVQLRFTLPVLGDAVTVDAHVRWVQPGDGVGVQFAGLRAREVWALQKLFSEHRADASGG
jgi:hypothetical protein